MRIDSAEIDVRAVGQLQCRPYPITATCRAIRQKHIPRHLAEFAYPSTAAMRG
jgi:hypothetical protein